MASDGSGLSPPGVPPELHVKNREKLLKSLRLHLTESSRPLRGFVLLQVYMQGPLFIHFATKHFSILTQEIINSAREARSKIGTIPTIWNSSGTLSSPLFCAQSDGQLKSVVDQLASTSNLVY